MVGSDGRHTLRVKLPPRAPPAPVPILDLSQLSEDEIADRFQFNKSVTSLFLSQIPGLTTDSLREVFGKTGAELRKRAKEL